ncbi:xylulose kinase isoform X1 [Diabrotica virgifera virgifera]|uniref:Xylulose kinase n=2 Tax=Diabrotica virgifera virgifera TaxID=50390 RepID=A0A6P7F470_DIAVI|nr:xylulose kinase isoform X1 [Diabrotica virgifera virgifera]
MSCSDEFASIIIPSGSIDASKQIIINVPSNIRGSHVVVPPENNGVDCHLARDFDDEKKENMLNLLNDFKCKRDTLLLSNIRQRLRLLDQMEYVETTVLKKDIRDYQQARKKLVFDLQTIASTLPDLRKCRYELEPRERFYSDKIRIRKMGDQGDNLYLGLDLSTQQLKAAVVNEKLEIVAEQIVIYDSDLPEFRTQGGAIIDKINNAYITSPTLMWVKALDIVLDKLTVAGINFSKIAAISGSGQQHGSVYWQRGASQTLANLNPGEFLHQQLAHSFAVANSPIWMDSSTTKQCQLLEQAVGGPMKLAEITGSRAYERFTGSQICKINQTRPDAYKSSERISLVSSFVCSLFAGKIAPIDISDGSGMNLMNIKTKKWDETLLAVCGSNLAEKLGDPVPSTTIVGNVSPYYVDRYNFNPNCKTIACTGDNPASLIGMRLSENWIAVSLGTSDTVFLWLQEPKIVLDGHVLCNPIDENAYMGMLCFKNGSFTRERIRDQCAEGSWDVFNELLESTPRGNFGNIGLYYDNQEIIPFLHGDYRFSKGGRVTKFNSLEVEVRAVIEGQCIRNRAYSEDFGLKIDKNTKILATGGASNNKAILQVLSDVFNVPVYVQQAANSAMLGAAYQAKHGLFFGQKSYRDVMSPLPEPELACTPYQDAESIYIPMVHRYRAIVKELTAQ